MSKINNYLTNTDKRRYGTTDQHGCRAACRTPRMRKVEDSAICRIMSDKHAVCVQEEGTQRSKAHPARYRQERKVQGNEFKACDTGKENKTGIKGTAGVEL